MRQKDLSLRGSNKIHYGWIIALTGMAVLFSCLGLGRFSLGMLLPSMGISLNLSYSQMGLIGTGNFVGYMISVILAGLNWYLNKKTRFMFNYIHAKVEDRETLPPVDSGQADIFQARLQFIW